MIDITICISSIFTLFFNDFKRTFSKLPSRKSTAVLWDSHIIETSLNLIIFVCSPSWAFQSFWICIFVNVMLIIQLRLRIAWNSFIAKLRNHRHVILWIYLEWWIIHHLIGIGNLCLIRIPHHWVVNHHPLNDILSRHYQWVLVIFKFRADVLRIFLHWLLHINVKIAFLSCMSIGVVNLIIGLLIVYWTSNWPNCIESIMLFLLFLHLHFVS